MGPKTVFFGELRFLSSLLLEVHVLGSLQIQTVFYFMLQYIEQYDTSRNVVMVPMKAKKIVLVVIAFFFVSNSQRTNF